MDIPALLRELQAQHGPAFYWARQCCDFDEERAREVLQEVNLKILEGRARFDGRASVKTWLFSVIRLTALEWQRTYRVHYSLEQAPEQEEEPYVAERSVEEQLLGRLSPQQREVLLLVFYHGHTLEEAAAVMQLALGTVRTHYARAKARLKALIEKQEKDEA
ncbi:ECF subfamily RNA polymerase sigma-24 subunit [Nitritalea halalkaliphila LW7]|uniref:ECF subfamily RNA polymerase sigma-24 subunit n=1 Tax=Nitritalea halalkaliphila LW7 TaxID=1189621 RepID=I5BTF3_9BACT|nr:RNA polymerase sigma factor [Nitritalea halalkaliphila]EIM72855.1 ECF subfamily RNA polymerase sigma-24 subunit [Nitritalea halalkaliphila LW7]